MRSIVQTLSGVGLADVKAVYDGAEGDLWELVMGEQIHMGGLSASLIAAVAEPKTNTCPTGSSSSTATLQTTELPDESADFVWGEDARCYVDDKAQLIAEAVCIVRPGGTIAFSDWLAGPEAMSPQEAERFLRFMKFPNVLEVDEYRGLLEECGGKWCQGRFVATKA
jgi:sarcosine/dimethylglycine N-methyltransferase